MRKLLFCLFFLCFPWLWLRAQQRIAFARLPPFERAVVSTKIFVEPRLLIAPPRKMRSMTGDLPSLFS